VHAAGVLRQQRHVGVGAAADTSSRLLWASPHLTRRRSVRASAGSVGLHADDRLDVVLLGRPPELVGAEHEAVVGGRQGGMPISWAALSSSSIRAAPSSIEYSVWLCRCTKFSADGMSAQTSRGVSGRNCASLIRPADTFRSGAPATSRHAPHRPLSGSPAHPGPPRSPPTRPPSRGPAPPPPTRAPPPPARTPHPRWMRTTSTGSRTPPPAHARPPPTGAPPPPSIRQKCTELWTTGQGDRSRSGDHVVHRSAHF
jgi:hypothetical protein